MVPTHWHVLLYVPS